MSVSQAVPNSRKVIYDLGSNNGDDIPYYLHKGDLVVAVEANPSLAEGIRRLFAGEIRRGLVVVENCVLTADSSLQLVPFFVHRSNHVLSQFPPPAPDVAGEYLEMALPARPLKEVFSEHGEPYYVKVDLEHYDALILEALFREEIRPPFISAESHSVDIFCLLVTSGKYRAFKLVDGSSVSQRFGNHSIKGKNGDVRYSFPPHSAGPFGEDIPGPWLTATNMFKLLAYQGLGWKDIHATQTEEPDPLCEPKLQVRLRWTI